MTDFSGCRTNVGGFVSAVWEDPFGVAWTLVDETIDDVMTKIRQGHPGEAASMVVGGGRFKAISKIGSLGDLSASEIRAIQGVVNEAGRPLAVVGSTARGARRGIGTDLPIGKGVGTRGDIDYLVPYSSLEYFESTGLYKNLPLLDRIIPGVHNPYIGPAIRFESFSRPYFIPGGR